MSAPTPGDRVRWTFMDVPGTVPVVATIEGTVVDRQTQFGRIAVLADDGTEHHIQPSFVEVVSGEQA